MNSFLNVSITLFVYVKTVFEAILGMIPVGSLVLYISSTKKVEEMINSGVHGVFTLSTELMYANFIFEFYDLLNNEKTNIGTEKIDHIDKIELKNVSYEYTSGKSVLKNINCEFSAGNNYAIIGKNGSGKSTLIKLLSGLYDDYSGQILINGIDFKKIDIESYFQTISVQYQDFNNYEMNVEKNILIGNINDNTKDENKFNEVTTMTGVDDFVSVMPEK